MSVTLLLSSCQWIKGVGGYTPPGLPLKVTIDTNGEINFELETEVAYPTPLGTFSVGIVVDPVEYFNKNSTLTIRLDCEDNFYDLHGQDFNIEFESGYYEKINLNKRGNDILLDIRHIDSSPENCPLSSVPENSTEINGLLSAIKQRGYILVATDPNYQPYSFLNTNGKRLSKTNCPSDTLTTPEMLGFDVDVAHKLGDALGVETCFATPSWDTITVGNWGDKWDISVGSMTILITRQKVLYFSTPYYYIPAVIAVRFDSNITSIQDLTGKGLCVASATVYESWLNDWGLELPISSIYSQPPSNIQVVSLVTDQECAYALAIDNNDFVGYITSESVVDANISAGLPVRKLGTPIFSEDLAVAIDKFGSLDSVSLLNELNKIIEAMHRDGTLSSLSVQWFDIDLSQDPNK